MENVSELTGCVSCEGTSEGRLMGCKRSIVVGLLAVSCGTSSSPTECTIGATTFKGEATNPAVEFGVCQVCTPALNPNGWTNAKVGTACGMSQVCLSGGRCARAFRKLTGTGTSTWYDVGGTAGEVWVVGAASRALKSTDQGANWSAVALPGLSTRYGVFSPSAGHAFIVGSGGSVLETTNGGESFTVLPAPMFKVLKGVWGTGAELFVVGTDGFIGKSTNSGQAWTTLRSSSDGGVQLTLNAIWGDASGIVVVGDNGTILRSTNRMTFDRVPVTSTIPLLGVYGTGQSVFAVGSAGTIWRTKDRERWELLTTSIRQDLTDVWGVGSEVYVSTEQGLVYRSVDDGLTWAELSSAGAQTVYGLWGSSTDDLYAVGSSGVVLRTP